MVPVTPPVPTPDAAEEAREAARPSREEAREGDWLPAALPGNARRLGVKVALLSDALSGRGVCEGVDARAGRAGDAPRSAWREEPRINRADGGGAPKEEAVEAGEGPARACVEPPAALGLST